MVSSELAMELRMNFAMKKKEGTDFGEIFLQNVVTVATGQDCNHASYC